MYLVVGFKMIVEGSFLRPPIRSSCLMVVVLA